MPVSRHKAQSKHDGYWYEDERHSPSALPSIKLLQYPPTKKAP